MKSITFRDLYPQPHSLPVGEERIVLLPKGGRKDSASSGRTGKSRR